jgi:hypothetical protein
MRSTSLLMLLYPHRQKYQIKMQEQELGLIIDNSIRHHPKILLDLLMLHQQLVKCLSHLQMLQNHLVSKLLLQPILDQIQ